MRLPTTAHTSRPWRIHELAPDFAVEDVWALPTPGGPDDFLRLVELVSASDPAVDDVVQANGRPAVLGAADRGDPVGQRGQPVPVADQDVASLQPEGAVGEVAPSPEVVEDLVEPAVGPRDGAAARDGPGDAGGEDLPQRRLRAARVERVLGLVEAVEQGDGRGPLHAQERSGGRG